MNDSFFWTALFVLMAGMAGWNAYENHHLKRVSNLPAETTSTSENQEVRSYELAQSGKLILWPESMEVLGSTGETPLETYEGYGLVLALDDLSCDVCRDEQTQFALSVAREMNEPLLRIVVSSSKKMYARSYMRLNSVDVPVYYDQDRAFIEQNQLGKTPLLMFHNPQGEVIAAHFPIPGKPEVSQPFHKFCRDFLGLENQDELRHAAVEARLN